MTEQAQAALEDVAHAMTLRSGDGRSAGAADLVGARRKRGGDHRQAVGPAPFGRAGVKASDLRNVARFGDRAELADLLFVFIDVYMRVGNRVDDAKHQGGKEGASLPYAIRSDGRARHGLCIAELGDATDGPRCAIRPRGIAQTWATAVHGIGDVAIGRPTIHEMRSRSLSGRCCCDEQSAVRYNISFLRRHMLAGVGVHDEL